ncbi:MAG: protein-L-isoaspartate O-methyltransferase [SAR202 cluster bacterium Io17-Chloro-G1]|nr:MAG: protein-L-isoaspartate O-methyltransferase [SAR202 cluster bacterium Io17-Chloro-G1]
MDFDTERDKKALFDRISVELDDQRVIEAMLRVPREEFVPAEAAHLAYADMALPIGYDQTISQPYMVALMTSVLGVRRMDRVLDIGTGSGYQAAVLAELAREVVSTERILTLIRPAESRLQSLGYANITVKRAGRELGLPGEPRFNGIIVGAGAPKLPTELVEQLEIGGRLVVPVGSRQEQQLIKVVRTHDGFSVDTLGGCRFVPLIGEGAWPGEGTTIE